VSGNDSIAANIAEWTQTNAEHTDANARRAWEHEGILWGVFAIPEQQVNALPGVDGLDVIELGCGTAYFGSWLARRGARVVGVDPTPAQLATARRMQKELNLEFLLVEAPGESVPLPDESFDLAVSEYGASLWADPYQWIPEAARLLRPGGRLVFLTNSTLVYLCAPTDVDAMVGEKLMRDQFGMYRIQ
jgi:ubiquinone/menaquinone biosynthesis C-methylase UbiE